MLDHKSLSLLVRSICRSACLQERYSSGYLSVFRRKDNTGQLAAQSRLELVGERNRSESRELARPLQHNPEVEAVAARSRRSLLDSRSISVGADQRHDCEYLQPRRKCTPRTDGGAHDYHGQAAGK